jgi:hypothetical protein
MIETFPAITIWQPWASLIAAGAKPYEWRGWRAPRRLVGKRIAIHAGARRVQTCELAQLLYELRYRHPDLTSLDVPRAVPLLDQWLTSPGSLPLSSVLCLATLGEPITAASYAEWHGGIRAADSDRVDHTKWGWPLTDIEAVQPFVPAKGRQGIWHWTPPNT